MRDSLYDRELEQLRAALRTTAPQEGSHEWDGLESPDPEGRVRAAAAWGERAACLLWKRHPWHPMAFHQSPSVTERTPVPGGDTAKPEDW